MATLFIIVGTASAQVLVSLGSNGFTIDPGSTAPHTQNQTSLTFNSAIGLGDTVYGGLDTAYDWSSFSLFGLELNVVGTNPNLPISVFFYDSSFNLINEYSLTTTGVGSSPTIVPLTLASIGTGDLSDVAGFQLTWAGAGTVNSTFNNVVAVPEPATWALVTGTLTAAMAFRRRRVA